MPHDPADRSRSADSEVMTHARLIAGGLAALGMTRDEAVAILLHNDPVYLSVLHACRIAGCRIRQINAHSTREQIVTALAEPGIRAAFVHDYFLPVLTQPPQALTLIAVTPLSLFPGATPGARDGRRHHAYHQWLGLQEERSAPLRARRGRSQSNGSAAVSGDAVAGCLAMFDALTRGAGDPPPPADGASPR